MYRLISVGIGIVLIAFVLGCGSTGKNTTTAGVTKAQYFKQVSEVCSKTKQGIKARAVAWQKDHAGNELDWDTALKHIIGPALKQEAGALDALTPPDEIQNRVGRMLANLSKGSAVFVAEGADADPSSFEQSQDEAEAFGLDACNL